MIRAISTTELEQLFPLCDGFSASSSFVSYKKQIFLRTWYHLIETGLGLILVSVKNARFTGMIGGMRAPDPNTGELVATEFFWFVDPNHRGEGIQLLDEFEAWAKDEGCKKIIMVYLLDSTPDKVRRVYERRGYKPVEVHYIKEI